MIRDVLLIPQLHHQINTSPETNKQPDETKHIILLIKTKRRSEKTKRSVCASCALYTQTCSPSATSCHVTRNVIKWRTDNLTEVKTFLILILHITPAAMGPDLLLCLWKCQDGGRYEVFTLVCERSMKVLRRSISYLYLYITFPGYF